jgi:hypothetical protein
VKPSLYADIADLPEDQRIVVIGNMAMTGKIVAFIVDDNEKANRYLRKLREKFPMVVEVDRLPDVPIKNVVSVKVGLIKGHA